MYFEASLWTWPNLETENLKCRNISKMSSAWDIIRGTQGKAWMNPAVVPSSVNEELHSDAPCAWRSRAKKIACTVCMHIGPWGRKGIYGSSISVEDSNRIEMKFQAIARGRHDKRENTHTLQPQGFEEGGACRRIQTKGQKTEFLRIAFAVRDRQNGKECASGAMKDVAGSRSRGAVVMDHGCGFECECEGAKAERSGALNER
ncbi:hypothetical protein B0H13DRAFT_1872519 [Mycena leptocephala]|nr:hypothetical protein B0H13DRAFT_1872519 [Mycena leptocephala]